MNSASHAADLTVRLAENTADDAMSARACPWCGEPYLPRTNGGKAQRFCSEPCRRGFDRALRAWAQRQWAAGRVKIGALQRARCSDGHQADG